jgi:hypothetical protein
MTKKKAPTSVAENGLVIASGQAYSRRIDALARVAKDYPGIEIRIVPISPPPDE